MRAVLALIVLLAFAVAPGRALDGRQFRLHGGRLVDERRREVTLRGVNARVEGIFDVTFGDGRLSLEPIPVFDDGDAATMARFGLNLLRLPISWSGLEPVRGRFDTAYLDRIAAVVALCRAHGIVVLLDFHQDAFSKEIGEDGAPRWVLDLLLGSNNYPYLGGPLTDLGARRRAPATLAACRQFFLDAGGVQEDLAAAAVVLARRFARERGVLGYEILRGRQRARASRSRPAVAFDLLEQVIHLDGLRHAFDHGQSGGALRGEVVGGDDDDGHLGEGRVLQLLGAELPPVHDRHPEIEEDHAEPRRVCGEMLKRLLSVRGFHHGVALAFEDGREGAADVGVVFYDQDALRVLLHVTPCRAWAPQFVHRELPEAA